MTVTKLASASANARGTELLVIADHDGDVGNWRRGVGCAVVVVPFGLLDYLGVRGGVALFCSIPQTYCRVG